MKQKNGPTWGQGLNLDGLALIEQSWAPARGPAHAGAALLWFVIGKPAFRLFWKLAALDRAPRIRRAMLEVALWADQPSHRGTVR